ncbi:MAG: acetylornithine deacetylase [Candidatus Bathyarchaeia archaeon]
MKEEVFEKVLGIVDEGKDEVVEFLSELIRFRTPNPPGGNTLEAQRWFSEKLSEAGFSIETFEIYPGDPNVIGVIESKSAGRSIILNGHMDVAEVREDERWKYEPFKPTLTEGKMYGRGAADMKGGLTAAYMALKSIRRAGVELKGKIIFECVTGEEVGERGTEKCIEKGYTADLAIVPEPTSLKISGQGGAITGWITIKSPTTLHDGVRRKIIHAGGGIVGASAIEKMMKIISSLQELERHWAVIKTHPLMPLGSTTINPAVIRGGRHPAFIADECNLWITVHFLPGENYEDVIKEIEDHVLRLADSDIWLRDNPPSFRWGGTSMTRDDGEVFPSCELDPENPGIKTLIEAHTAVTKRVPEITMWPSVSDSGWLARAGIPTVNYGPGSLEQAHAVDEYVELDEVVKATKVIALALLKWCGFTIV